MNKLYTASEILEQLKTLERVLLRRVFKASYSDNLRTYDLIGYLKSKLTEVGLGEQESCAALINDLEKLSKAISSLINGKRGEQMAAKSLGCLRDKCLLLSNIALQNGDSFEEYDQIVIAPGGVFIVEVKNLGHDSIIDEGGILRCGPYAYNVGERMLEKRRALWDAIRFSTEGFMSENDIHGMLLFVNDKSTVRDFFRRVPVKRRGQIVYDLDRASENGLSLSREEMSRIKASVVTRMVEAKFPMPVDSAALIDELNAVLEQMRERTEATDKVKTQLTAETSRPDLKSEKATWQQRITEWLPIAAALVVGAIGARGLAKTPIRMPRSLRQTASEAN